MLMDGITLHDLRDRLIVEPELAARAAERASLEDLQKMRRTLEVSRRGGDAGMTEADIAFHRAIFEAARNPICSRMFSLIHRAMANSIGLTSQVVDWEHTLGFHRPIYTAIEKRRPVDARLAMIAHLRRPVDRREAGGEGPEDRHRPIASLIENAPEAQGGREERMIGPTVAPFSRPSAGVAGPGGTRG
jgi:DNA-binding FadR family transcriptional regulator